ncbi:hypothetical protein Dimus_022232 [Dionaea muscipula]
MGCAVSRQSRRRCEHCKRATYYSPVSRSHSMNIGRPPEKKAKDYHFVALKSSTLGSLELDPLPEDSGSFDQNYEDGGHGHGVEQAGENVGRERKKEFEIGLIEAKSWSKMIDDKMIRITPRTPIITPPGEPEKINAWELMEGLEDISPLRPVDHKRSFSFNASHSDSIPPSVDSPKVWNPENNLPFESHKDSSSNANANFVAETIDSDFDPELISLFRKTFQELPPTNPFHLRSFDHQQDQREIHGSKMNGVMHSEAVQNREWNSIESTKSNHEKEMETHYGFDGKKIVVLYLTSLRGVRKTYEDCCNVRVILKSLGLRVDERDVSMHSGFKEELRELLGTAGFNRPVGLPRVFAGEKYIGGADEIRRMHEEGKLEKVLESFKMSKDDGGGEDNGYGLRACDACGDIRFLPCVTCSGSCKIYYEAVNQEDEGNEVDCEESEYGFQRCPDCNENGLVRCPICCDL